MDKAISKKRGIIKMAYRGAESSVTDFGRSIEAITIDDLVFDNDIDVALIKMDIEGMELPTIWEHTGPLGSSDRFYWCLCTTRVKTSLRYLRS